MSYLAIVLRNDKRSHSATRSFYAVWALARVSDGARPTLLVVNRGEIEKRWMDRPPGANLRWLERERTLNVAEEIGPWSISRVGRGIAASEGVK